MTTGYTGVAPVSFTNLLSGPAADEFVTGASVGLLAQSAANQDKYLYDGIVNILANSVVIQNHSLALNPVGTGGGALQTFSTFDGNFHNSTSALIDITGAKIGDVIDARIIMDVQGTAVAADFELRLRAFEDHSGANVEHEIVGAYWNTETPNRIQMTMAGTRTVAANGTLRVILQVKIGEAASSLFYYGTGSLIVNLIHVGLS